MENFARNWLAGHKNGNWKRGQILHHSTLEFSLIIKIISDFARPAPPLTPPSPLKIFDNPLRLLGFLEKDVQDKCSQV
jgi:hypothetical protein